MKKDTIIKKHENNEKFSGIFERIGIILTERKKESKKTYFKKISPKSVYLILMLATIIMNMFYNSFIFNESNKTLQNILLYVPLIIVAGSILFLFKSKNSLSGFFYAVPLIMVGFTFNYFLENSFFSYIGNIFLGIGYGIVLAQSIIFFLFSFNTSERLLSILILLFLIFSFSYLYAFEIEDIIRYYIIPMIIYLATFVSVFFIDKADYLAFDEKGDDLDKTSLITLLSYIGLVIINIGVILSVQIQIHKNIDIQKTFYSMSFYLGFLVSLIVLLLIFMYSKKATITSIIFFTVGLVCSYQLAILSRLFIDIEFFRQVSDAGFGFCLSIGVVSFMMMLGKIFEDHSSRKLVSYVTLFIIFDCIGAFFVCRGFIRANLDILFTFMFFMTVIQSATIIAVIFLGYFEPKNTINKVTFIEENIKKFKVINPEEVLTIKEKAVFNLLLAGLTLRQISGELGMKYDTVNFHYKNIYKKLEVNSKIELYMRYNDKSGE